MSGILRAIISKTVRIYFARRPEVMEYGPKYHQGEVNYSNLPDFSFTWYLFIDGDTGYFPISFLSPLFLNILRRKPRYI